MLAKRLLKSAVKPTVKPGISRTAFLLLSAAVAVLMLTAPDAQARRGVAPLSHSIKSMSLDPVPVETLAGIDTAKRAKEDAARTGGPLRYAIPVQVSVNTSNAGLSDQLGGGVLWRSRFYSPGATDLNFGFTSFHLPEGATLHVSSEDYDYFEGPYDHRDNEKHGQLWTPMVPGDRAVVELWVPNGLEDEVQLELTHVGAGYRNVLGMGIPSVAKQGSCNNDVICPEGDPWRDQISSVAAFSTGGSAFCTGTLIMDAEATFRNFFLTAAHCGMNSGNAPSLVVFWNFESPTCGALGGGSLSENQTGSVFRASRADVDMTLLELDDDPDEAFGVYYAGWDRSGVAPTGSVGIHHPNTDEKAISFNDDLLATSNSCISSGGVASHWEVDNWEDGTTEPGSSGSALFHPTTKRVIGFLSGGDASCENPAGLDCYGKFSVGWDGDSSSTRMRDWLDPNLTGLLTVDGAEPSPRLRLASSTVTDICATGFGNGNGVCEPGETVDLDVTLSSTGAFTGISGTLTSSTPGVTILDGNVNWPDLGSGGSAAGTTSFSVKIAGTSTCFSTIDLDLEVTANEGGPFPINILHPVGASLVPNVPLPIPDGDPVGVGSDLVVAEDVTLTDVNVRVEASHTYVGDLSFVLRSPLGSEVILLDQPGEPASEFGCSDENMNVTFDDASGVDLETHCAATNPWYSGTAAPVGSLAAFNGESSAGTWTLQAFDGAGQDTGSIVDWELLTTPALNGTCATCINTPGIDLSVSKSDSDDPIAAGGTLVYTVTVTNSGATAAPDVVVTDLLPAEVALVSTSGCAEDPAGVPTCTLGNVGGFSSKQYTITVTVNTGVTGPISNDVSVVTSGVESLPGDESDSEITIVTDCGNSAVNAGTGEDCDDGNTADGDCCDRNCQAEASGSACPDGNDCTDNQCNGAGLCLTSNNSAPCDDGLFCTGTDQCSGGGCNSHVGDPCVGNPKCADLCNEAGDTCNEAAGTACADDSNQCTDDECDGAGVCQHAINSAPCDDGIACTVTDICSAGLCSGDAAVCALDEFKSYRAKKRSGTPNLTKTTVELADEFETKDMVVSKQKAVNAPVGRDGSGIELPPVHMECYKIKDEKQDPRQVRFAKRTVDATSPLGSIQLVIQRAQQLCIPTPLSTLGAPDSLPSHPVDAFKCYRARPKSGQPKEVFPNATLTDGFESKITRLIRTDLICTPVAVNGQPISAPDDHLQCFKIKDAPGQSRLQKVDVFTSTLFGSAELTIKNSQHLCVPATVTVTVAEVPAG